MEQYKQSNGSEDVDEEAFKKFTVIDLNDDKDFSTHTKFDEDGF